MSLCNVGSWRSVGEGKLAGKWGSVDVLTFEFNFAWAVDRIDGFSDPRVSFAFGNIIGQAFKSKSMTMLSISLVLPQYMAPDKMAPRPGSTTSRSCNRTGSLTAM